MTQERSTNEETLVVKMREVYSFLRQLTEVESKQMLFRTDTTKEERLFWAGVGDMNHTPNALYRPWNEEQTEFWDNFCLQIAEMDGDEKIRASRTYLVHKHIEALKELAK